MKMQKLGGYSAIVSVCLLIILIAIVLPFTLKHGLNEQGAGLDPDKVMTAYSSSPTTIYVAGILEILVSILGLLVVLGLYERMHGKAPYLTRIMIIAVSVSCALSITNIMISLRGLALMDQISDVSIYKPILMMQGGLSAASNNISGWVLLLIAIAALSTKALPHFITYVFLVIGILQVISFLLPGITGPAGMIVLIVVVLFLVVSYIWLGVVMIRESAASITKPIEA
jgi:hypothetical protein